MKKAVLLSVSLIATLAGAGAASAVEVFGTSPSVEVTVPQVTSQAMVAQQLAAEGFSGVQLSSSRATPVNPAPQLANADDPAVTPVHEGWNGTAEKDGRVYDVQVAFGNAPSVVERRG